MTSLTVSNTNPFPTHKPWSGGSTENWFPPFARRCWRWFSPRNARTCSGLDLAFTALEAAGPRGWASDRLRLTTLRASTVGPAGSACASVSVSKRNSGSWMASEPACEASPERVTVPPAGICLVVPLPAAWAMVIAPIPVATRAEASNGTSTVRLFIFPPCASSRARHRWSERTTSLPDGSGARTVGVASDRIGDEPGGTSLLRADAKHPPEGQDPSTRDPRRTKGRGRFATPPPNVLERAFSRLANHHRAAHERPFLRYSRSSYPTITLPRMNGWIMQRNVYGSFTVFARKRRVNAVVLPTFAPTIPELSKSRVLVPRRRQREGRTSDRCRARSAKRHPDTPWPESSPSYPLAGRAWSRGPRPDRTPAQRCCPRSSALSSPATSPCDPRTSADRSATALVDPSSARSCSGRSCPGRSAVRRSRRRPVPLRLAGERTSRATNGEACSPPWRRGSTSEPHRCRSRPGSWRSPCWLRQRSGAASRGGSGTGPSSCSPRRN